MSPDTRLSNFLKLADVEYGPGAYRYNQVIYQNRKKPVTIRCPDHGPFSVTPDAFLYSAGCPHCRGCHPRGYPAYKKRRQGSNYIVITPDKRIEYSDQEPGISTVYWKVRTRARAERVIRLFKNIIGY